MTKVAKLHYSRIFYLEDDEELNEAFIFNLKMKGFANYKSFFDAKSALVDIEDGDIPDIIITDINMPKMTGIELMQTLSKKGLNIPVIFLTAFNDKEFLNQAQDFNTKKYFVKPIKDFNKIIEAIKQTLIETNFIEQNNQLKESNLDLEKTITERNEELSIYNEELKTQNEELLLKEKALKDRVLEFRTLFYSYPNPFFIIDNSTKIIDKNHAASIEIVGELYPHLSNFLFRYIKKESKLDFNKYFSAIRVDSNIEPVIITVENFNNICKRYKVLITSHPTNNNYFLVNLYDLEKELSLNEELNEYRSNLELKVQEQVEELRQKDSEVLNQSKMAALGEMLTNIAHQWRQPLSIISTCSSAVNYCLDFGGMDKKEIKENLNNINEYCNELSKTIDSFSNYINNEKTQKTISIENQIKLTESLVSSSLKADGIELIDDIDYDKEHLITAIENDLSQGIINIINNAQNALVENKDYDNRWIKMSSSVENDTYTLYIEDNAGGIPEDIIDKVFEPYFTTKFKSQGKGLGLSMSYKIITENLKGTVGVENSENGAVFILKLPLL